MAERTAEVWVVRFIDSQDESGEPQVYLTEAQAARRITPLLLDLLTEAESEFSEDDAAFAEVFESAAAIRVLLGEGKVWEAYADWQSLDGEYEMARNIGSVEVEKGTLNYGSLEWLPGTK